VIGISLEVGIWSFFRQERGVIAASLPVRGNVLKLQARGNYYRLRVGNFRVLFLLAGNAIQVYAVKDRKDAYE